MSRSSCANVNAAYSAAMKSFKKTKTVAVKPACKHCENLNLSSDHWLRSLKGDIMCPVLLSTECRYCHLIGHTVKACPELTAKKALTLDLRPPCRRELIVEVPRVVDKNRFRVLDNVDSEEEEEEQVTPTHSVAVEEKTPSWNGKYTFAQVLTLTHPDLLEEVEYYPNSPVDMPPTPAPVASPVDMPPTPAPVASSYIMRITEKYKGMSWADIEDSDEDSD